MSNSQYKIYNRNVTINGNLKAEVVFSKGVQTLEGAGAVDLITPLTHLETTGANALTLADGEEGQIKTIVMTVDGGNGTLTPENLAGGTTVTFNDVGDSIQLLFTNDAWYSLGGTATLA